MSTIVYGKEFIALLARKEVSVLVDDLLYALHSQYALSNNPSLARVIIYSVLKHPAYLESLDGRLPAFIKVFRPILRAHHLWYEHYTDQVIIYRWLVQNKTRIILTLSQIK